MKSSRIQFAFALGLLALSIVGYFFWYSAVSAASANTTELEDSIAAASAANEEAEEARSAQSGLSQSEAAVGQYFLTNADVVTFLQNLQGYGSAVHAQVTVESVGANGTSVTSIVVQLHITGTFTAVAQTVGAIEYAPYDLTENSLNIQNGGKGAWYADMNITVGAQNATTQGAAVPAQQNNSTPTLPTESSSGSPTTQPL